MYAKLASESRRSIGPLDDWTMKARPPDVLHCNNTGYCGADAPCSRRWTVTRRAMIAEGGEVR